MSETQDDDEIIVIGHRLKATNESNSGGGAIGVAGGGNMLQARFLDRGTLQPIGGELNTPLTALLIGLNQDKHFDIPNAAVDLVVPEDSW